MTARNRSSVSAGGLPWCSTSRVWWCTAGRKRAPTILRSHCHWLRLAAAVRWATTCSTSHSPHRVSCRHCSAPRPASSSASAARSECASVHSSSSCGGAIRSIPLRRQHHCQVDQPRPLESSPRWPPPGLLTVLGWSGEVVTLLDVLDEAGMGGLPAEEVLGDGTGGRLVPGEQENEDAFVLLDGQGPGGQGQVAGDGLGDIAD